MPAETTEHDGNADMQEELGKVIDDQAGYHLYSWSPEPEGSDGKATQVHLVVPAQIDDIKFAVAVRLKSERAVNEMIDALIVHRDAVWGGK